MHTFTNLRENKKILAAIPAACLSFMTLGSFSLYGHPDNYLFTLSAMTIVITIVLIMILWRTKP